MVYTRLESTGASSSTVTYFYEKHLVFVVQRDSIAGTISQATSIETNYLGGPSSVREDRIASTCIAKKMSWLARRKTSRDNDMSYCMFGLFEVNIPLLYSEGGREALLRLQLEILSISDDESIFAWV
jgi:hypothetical protein